MNATEIKPVNRLAGYDKTEVRKMSSLSGRVAAASFAIGDNGEGAKTAPLHLMALSWQPCIHWCWGKIEFDREGLSHKSRITADWNHSDDEIIGYLNKFALENGLECDGALVPFKDSDRATEIIHKQKLGVPYEASVRWDVETALIEFVDEGFVSQVNGHEFTGPGFIVRQWEMLSVAVCPHGVDRTSETSLNGKDNGREIAANIFKKGASEMSNPAEGVKPVDAAAPVAPKPQEPAPAAGVDAGKAAEPKPGVDAAAGAKPEEKKVDAPAAPATDPARAECKKFLDAFGPKGAEYFAQGKSFENAQSLHLADVTAENKTLADKVKDLEGKLGKDRGLDTPVSVTPAGAKPAAVPGSQSAVKRMAEKFSKDKLGNKGAAAAPPAK